MSKAPEFLELLSPVERPTEVPSEIAPRLGTLAGTTIGLMENSKDNSAKMLDYIAESLQRDYGVKDFVRISKESASFPPADEVYDQLARMTDAVVTGVGD